MKAKKILLGNYAVLALLSPMLTLFSLLRSGNPRFIVPAGTIVMTLLGSVYIYLPGTDGATHLNTLNSHYLSMGFTEFVTAFFQLFVLNNENAPAGISDPYLHLLGFFAGGIFGVPELLHVFASFIYGLIYFNILKILFERITFPKGVSLIIILFSIFFINRGITGFNSIRWWTAFWLMFYGLLAYWHHRKSKFLILTLLSVYIHFSFVAFLFPALSAIWLYKRPKSIMVIWLVSFLIGANYNLIKPYVPNLEVIEGKEKYTLDEDQMALTAEARDKAPVKSQNFYAALGESTFRDYSIPLLIIFLFLMLKGISGFNKDLIKQLFAVGVLMYAFGNFMEFSGSVSGRAKAGASVFIMFSGLLTLSNLYKLNSSLYQSFKVRSFMSLFFISSIPLVLFHLSYTLNMLSAFALILPGASWFLGADDFSLRDFLATFSI